MSEDTSPETHLYSIVEVRLNHLLTSSVEGLAPIVPSTIEGRWDAGEDPLFIPSLLWR